MSLSPKQKLLVGLFALLALAVMGILRSTSRPSSVAIDIRLLGYATNSAGVKVARFDIQNNCSFTIERAWFAETQMETPTGWKILSNIQHPKFARGPAVPPNTSEIMEITAPNAKARWRLCVIFFEHKSQGARFIAEVQRALRSWGVPLKSRDTAYAFHSEPILP